MLVACWSAKGGSGTTVVAVALATTFARSAPAGALLVDLDGDVPAVLGLPEPDGPGIAHWLDAGPAVPADSLARLEVAGPGGVAVLPAGGPLPVVPERAEVLVGLLGADARRVVVDCGAAPAGVALAMAAAATQSLLVLRPSYLDLRQALRSPIRPSGVVLVTDDGSSFGAGDVEDVLGVPVRAVVRRDRRVARAVDAGLLGRRLPAGLSRALRHAA